MTADSAPPDLIRDEASGSFILARHAPARALLSDPNFLKDPDLAEPGAFVKTFKAAPPGRPADRDAGMIWLDGEAHARVRTPIQKAFYARVGKAAPLVRAIVSERLAAIEARGAFDLVADYAIPIPIAVIATILGVDPGRAPQFRAWSLSANKVFLPNATPADVAERDAAMVSILELFEALMEERRIRPRDDLITDLVSIQAQGAPLSDNEIWMNCAGLLVGGNLTTADLIGNAVWLLLTHRDQHAALLKAPDRINAAIEEALRVAPPVEGAQRIASADASVAGCPVATGQVVVVAVPAANRDPAAFPAPDRFDIGRAPAPHLAFGGGRHICIGAPLARLEAQIAVGELLSRFRRLAFSAPGAPAKWRATPFFRGLETLRLTI